MAYSIENFAAPVLANAKKQNKKAEKKVGLQNLALLGVQVANQALRSRADERAQEFFNGAQPILQRAQNNARDGFAFWGTHNRMLGTTYDPSDWRIAKAQQLYDVDIARSGVVLTDENKIEGFRTYMEDSEVQEKLNRYETQMGLQAQFKGGTTEAEKEAISTAYYGPIATMISQETERMRGDNTIFGSLMRSLNLKDESRLNDIDARGVDKIGSLNIEDLNADERAIIDFFNKEGERRSQVAAVSSLSGETSVDFKALGGEAVDFNDIYNNPAYAQIEQTLAKGDSTEVAAVFEGYDFKVTLPEGVHSAKELEMTKFMQMLSEDIEEGESASARVSFASDATTIASILEYRYGEMVANQESKTSKAAPPNSANYLQSAMELLLGNEGNLVRAVYTDGFINRLDYNPLSPMDLGQLALDAHSRLSASNFDNLFGKRGFTRDNLEIQDNEDSTLQNVMTTMQEEELLNKGGGGDPPIPWSDFTENILTGILDDPNSDLTRAGRLVAQFEGIVPAADLAEAAAVIAQESEAREGGDLLIPLGDDASLAEDETVTSTEGTALENYYENSTIRGKPRSELFSPTPEMERRQQAAADYIRGAEIADVPLNRIRDWIREGGGTWDWRDLPGIKQFRAAREFQTQTLPSLSRIAREENVSLSEAKTIYNQRQQAQEDKELVAQTVSRIDRPKETGILTYDEAINIVTETPEARQLLHEIAYVESRYGEHKNTFTREETASVFQIDRGRFEEFQRRQSTDPAINDGVGGVQRLWVQDFKTKTGIDLDTVSFEDLNIPIIGAAVTRALWKNVTAAIPTTTQGRAPYWKEYWNSYHPNAKGTVRKYMRDTSSSGFGYQRRLLRDDNQDDIYATNTSNLLDPEAPE